MYKLQLYSAEGKLFGGPARVKLLQLVEKATENDYNRKRLYNFRDPDTNEKYTCWIMQTKKISSSTNC